MVLNAGYGEMGWWQIGDAVPYAQFAKKHDESICFARTHWRFHDQNIDYLLPTFVLPTFDPTHGISSEIWMEIQLQLTWSMVWSPLPGDECQAGAVEKLEKLREVLTKSLEREMGCLKMQDLHGFSPHFPMFSCGKSPWTSILILEHPYSPILGWSWLKSWNYTQMTAKHGRGSNQSETTNCLYFAHI